MKRNAAQFLHTLTHRFPSLSSGFTLIELLIVISVLGVLAVVVLVAIDPLEQIARARDTGRINSVAELGHAMEAFAVNNQGAYPVPGSNWQTALVNAGEIKRLVSVPNTNTRVCAPQPHGDVCYYSTGTGSTQTAVIWTTLESKSTRNKARQNATSTASCPSGTNVVAMWSSAQGKAGIACTSTSTPPDAVNAYIN
jgi:prepilin-type N-terminal cleavage/methylation domain-containing protein